MRLMLQIQPRQLSCRHSACSGSCPLCVLRHAGDLVSEKCLGLPWLLSALIYWLRAEIFLAYVYLCAAYFGELCVPVHKPHCRFCPKNLWNSGATLSLTGLHSCFLQCVLPLYTNRGTICHRLILLVGFLWLLVLPSALF